MMAYLRLNKTSWGEYYQLIESTRLGAKVSHRCIATLPRGCSTIKQAIKFWEHVTERGEQPDGSPLRAGQKERAKSQLKVLRRAA
jgi:hypothetical protein